MRWPAEVYIYTMFKNPHHKPNKNEETTTCHPKIPCQRLQEHPCVLGFIVFDRYYHRHTRFRVRQGEVHVQRPVCSDRYVPNCCIEFLSNYRHQLLIRFQLKMFSTLLFENLYSSTYPRIYLVDQIIVIASRIALGIS